MMMFGAFSAALFAFVFTIDQVFSQSLSTPQANSTSPFFFTSSSLAASLAASSSIFTGTPTAAASPATEFASTFSIVEPPTEPPIVLASTLDSSPSSSSSSSSSPSSISSTSFTHPSTEHVTSSSIETTISDEIIHNNNDNNDTILASDSAPKVKIIQPPTDLQVILGSTALLTCAVNQTNDDSNNNATVRIDWFLNGRNLSDVIISSTTRRFFSFSTTQPNRIKINHENGTLIIEQIRPADVGVYECYARNTFNPAVIYDRRSARLDLIELPHPPLNLVATLINGASGTGVPSTSDSANTVHLSWTPPYNGNSAILKYIVQQRIVPGSGTSSQSQGESGEQDGGWRVVLNSVLPDQSTVELNNLLPAQTYQFRVIAVNKLGSGQPSLPTTPVTLPPSMAPSNVSGEAISPTSIKIRWIAPTIKSEVDDSTLNETSREERGRPIEGYTIRYKLAGYDSQLTPWYMVNVTSPNVTEFTLNNLIVWKIYEIQIASYNLTGLSSEFSKSIQIRTLEDVPHSPPQGITASPINSTTMQVSWRPPDPLLINGINKGYKVRAYINGTKAASEGEEDSHEALILAKESVVPPLAADEEQTAILSGLEPFTTYLVTVNCFTSAGDGIPNEPPIVVRTDEGVPNAVSSLEFEPLPAPPTSQIDSYIVKWSPPLRPNGHLIAYTLQYWPLDNESDIVTMNYTSTDNATVIKKLRPATEYKFVVTAWTLKGQGERREAVLRTSIPALGPLTFKDVTMNSLVVSWPQLSGLSTSLLGYEVSYQLLSDDDNQTRPFSTPVETRDNHLFVSGLEERQTYMFKVRAKTSAGLGPFQHGSVSTGPQPQSPPSPIHFIVSQTITSVQLRWMNPPGISLDHIRGYIIEARNMSLSAFQDHSFHGHDDASDLGLALGYAHAHEVSTQSDGSWYQVASIRNAHQMQFDLSFTQLPADLVYKFRLMSFNEYGVSEPVVAQPADMDEDLRPLVRPDDVDPSWFKVEPSLFQVGELQFSDITMTGVRVSWAPPKEPKNQSISYYVAYEPTSPTAFDHDHDGLGLDHDQLTHDGHLHIPQQDQVRLKIWENMIHVSGLRERTTYTFRVRAEIMEGLGPERIGHVTTGPQPGSPPPPTKFQVLKSLSSVKLRWRNPVYGQIRGYVIEAKRFPTPPIGTGPDGYPTTTAMSTAVAKSIDWEPIVTLRNGPQESYDLPLIQLQPSSSYLFRIMTLNDIGISEPAQLMGAQSIISTPPDTSCIFARCMNGGQCSELPSNYGGPSNFQCICPIGWTGDRCEKRRTCHSECARNQSQCISNTLCACLPNHSAPNFHCDPIDCSVHGHLLCRNGGKCITVEQGGYFCSCPENTRGLICETVLETGVDYVLILIISLICLLMVALSILSVIFIKSVRKARATRGTYSPSTQEMFGNSAAEILKPPPEERLI